MDDIFQMIQTCIVISIAGFFLAFFLVSAFYKGKKIKIDVINKRITEHSGLNAYRTRWTSSKNYTLDCKYEGSDRIHTLRCSSYVYESLKAGKHYTVTIKFQEIIKIHK